MYYAYVIKSQSHDTRYVGTTNDIYKRLNEHNSGKCRYTSGRRPWQLVYKEEYSIRGKAMKREKFLKSGQGRKFLDKILLKNEPLAENPTAGAKLYVQR
ncbi:GIY-YIG nuclease family protein [Patescibacteria group bacterium]|nr:GIY-YIG nuclease family protein [Patescibacteria group bacterium]